jgi:hypothetical protein
MPVIVERKTFEENFRIFTEGLLDDLNWDNVFCAGGAVAACLSPIPVEFRETKKKKREYFHQIAHTGSDIDLFLYGFKTDEEANEKLQEIYFSVFDKLPLMNKMWPVICFRSQHAVTIVSQYPYR